MKPGLKDIAKAAGVAISTVSHVLNGTAPISDSVRERVLGVARQLGYLERRRSKTMMSPLSGLLLALPVDCADTSDTNLVSSTIVAALQRECRLRSIRLVIHVSETNRIDPAEIAALAADRSIQGVVIFNDDRSDALRLIAATGLPAVLMNGEDPEMSVDTVTPSNRHSAYLAARHLIQLGHRRILHLTWPGRGTIRRRVDGFRDAMREAGLPCGDDLILEVASYRPTDAEAALDLLLAEDPGLRGATAILCAADNLALGTLKALARHGIRVPHDCSVLGFDDLKPCELSRPPLSTVHVPLDQMALVALNLIEQRLLANDPARVAARVELGCRLVHRASVASPPVRELVHQTVPAGV
jgi:LacI family transcriptional regulator, purine nucleotide synthesis repressor